MTDDAMLIIDMRTALLNTHPARELDVRHPDPARGRMS